MITDLDIHRSAYKWLQLHREEAVPRARAMVAEMRRLGDNDGADKWLHIIVAIGTLGAPSDRRH